MASTSTSASSNDDIICYEGQTAFKNRIRTLIIENITHKDPKQFLEAAFIKVETVLQEELEKQMLKINACFTGEFIIPTKSEESPSRFNFNSKNDIVMQTTDLHQWWLEKIQNDILEKIENFQLRGSGWALHSIVKLYINMNYYNPLHAGTCVDLPDVIKKKHACVNVQNVDNECFRWSILAALYPPKSNPHRVQAYLPYRDEIKFDGIAFPVSLKDVPTFEKLNKISINVYQLEDGKVWPIHITEEKQEKHVNLLRITKETPEEGLTYHYVWISHLGRLVRSQVTKHKSKIYICERCLHHFYDEAKKHAHEEDCSALNKNTIPRQPTKEESILQFRNYKNKERVPFVVYADFESLLKRSQSGKDEHRNENVVQHHIPFSVGFYVKCNYDDALSRYSFYSGKEPAVWLTEELHKIAKFVQTIYRSPIDMNLTREEEDDFSKSTQCHICVKPILGNDRVRDHCHFTGKYRGAAHNSCNLDYRKPFFIPVVFHNFSNYDCHFIIKEICTRIEGPVRVIPESIERYRAIIKDIQDINISLRFIDSYRFLSSSLDVLASSLDFDDLNVVRRENAGIDDQKLDLLKRKGVLPYDYIDSRERLQESSLPPKEKFYNQLTQTSISDKDYKHARNVWKSFDCKNLLDYTLLYMKTDVLLLADVFENFRDKCLETYGLDPAHYYSTPGLTWDAMLKYTSIELELLTDMDMIMFIEKGIRGGISQCCNRYAKANNEYLSRKSFCPNEPLSYLMYYDVNNLYGHSMMQYLPYGGFKWVDNVDQLLWDVSEQSEFGYILEVDLEYPSDPNIHDEHRDLPFCAEQKIPPGGKLPKLLTTLENKVRYVIHYRILSQAVSNGLKLRKIHRVVEFKQSAWLKNYIELNTTERKKAKNEFEQSLYKLMNNAVYGKTMENVRKYRDVKLVTKWEGRYGAEALIAKPSFKSLKIFEEDFVAIEMRKIDVLFNKPIYIGFCVLELSKHCLYDFHYSFMLTKFGVANCKLLYTDTDSLIYHLTGGLDIYEVMKENISKFDTSKYSKENPFDMPLKNDKVIGLMKDECEGKLMLEFVGLRSKMYAIRVDEREDLKKAKGVKKGPLKFQISFDDYLECLRLKKFKTVTQYSIRSSYHKISTIEQENRIALSPNDDKRYLLPDSHDTLPWGHYKVPK